ncbi:MAG: FAD-binding oxidoreductase [Bacteroidales bacterium]|nr:FAD-binding oxidoreductase [Bacteroidales bacterium]
MVKKEYSEFLNEMSGFLPKDRIYVDDLQRLAWGTDAGFYRMVPQIVIRSDNELEVSKILKAASRNNLPVTFRAAGTSLSGQAVSDSILIVAGKHWEKYSVKEDGAVITLQPGIVGNRVNQILAPYKHKFGPDPASSGSCMVGGIVMNNASGMCCGTWANSDRMMTSARIVFMDGTILDTADKESKAAFASSHSELLKGIEDLRDEILSDKELLDRINYKYSIKNVTGLNIYPFVKFQDPFDILAHLLVGSEGTLAFLSEVTMKTLPVAPFKASAMIYFKDIQSAAKGVLAIKKLKVSAAELLDKRSLTSVSDPTLEIAASQGVTDLTSVLTETQAQTPEELKANIEEILAALSSFETVVPINFTDDPKEYAKYWAIRSGIFPTVGGLRKQGTTCLIEDVAFHIENLPEATADLSELLDKHGYDDSCIYGHALEGNFHFIINQAFDSDTEVRRYEAMIRDVAKMVVEKYDGSLKAEHGTGRNMAPFVKYEWGEKAFSVMKRVKALFDPKNLLNPGVIFNDDPECYIKNFKALPVIKPGEGVSEEMVSAYQKINKCIECGFCEVNCLSCGFTMSSRTRIVAQREITRLTLSGENPELLKTLKDEYKYLGNQTCAGDGLCSMSCSMGISVADLTHEIRRQSMPPGSLGYKAWNMAADHFHGTKNGIRAVLHLANLGQTVLGTSAMSGVCKTLHKAGIPLWTPAMPKAYSVPDIPQKEEKLKVVYFPSCLNQMMGNPKKSDSRKPLAEEMVSLLNKAGYEVIFPENKDSLCCGTIWESKGMPDIADKKVFELEEALWKASEQGKYPVLCDQSPCLHRMRQKITKMKLYEPAEFIWLFLRDKLEFHRTDKPVAIHATCTMRLMKLNDTLYNLASLCSSKVLVPEGVGCCGFAGDKGMTNPEVNAYALRKLKDQVEKAGITIGYSNSRTCEIGLTTNSGIPYISIAYLVNECTTAKE